MTKQFSTYPPLAKNVRRKFQPYAMELAGLILAWNELHENLGILFWNVTGLQEGNIPLAVWHSTSNDRTQREMLKAATKAARLKRPGLEQHIIWLLNYLERLSDQRNDALHSPFWLAVDNIEARLIPAAFFGHPRAKKLQDKNLLNEFRWYRECAEIIALFAGRLATCAHDDNYPLPDKPQLPHLGQSPSRSSKRHRKAATPRRLRPPPSQA